MHDQAHHWSNAASRYEQEFVDPYQLARRNPVLDYLTSLDAKRLVVADLGCGIGPLLPLLSDRFARVHAIDFAPDMLRRARERVAGRRNVTFHQLGLTDLGSLAGKIDVAVAINSLVMPDVGGIEQALGQVRQLLKPGGIFLGIVPAIDAVHYHTMLLLDRARALGMPEDKARQNAGHLAEHSLYDFAFGGFRYLGLRQHFWQPFEVAYRLHRAGFAKVRRRKVYLDWSQFAAGKDFADQRPAWDWCFLCRRPREG